MDKHEPECKCKTKKHDEATVEEKMITSASFVLLFPSLIIAVIAISYSTTAFSFIVVGLAIYQFLMVKKFLEDYYR